MAEKCNLAGQAFGQWTVINEVPKDGAYHRKWLCRCACGNEAVVREDVLIRGESWRCRTCASAFRRKIKDHDPEEVRAYMADHTMAEGEGYFKVSRWTLREFMRQHGIPKAKVPARKQLHFRPDRQTPETVPVLKPEQVIQARKSFKQAALEPGLHYEETSHQPRVWPYSGQACLKRMKQYEQLVRRTSCGAACR